MALLHATQLFSGDIVGTATITLYTVPTGNRIILREIDFQSHAAVSTTVVVLVTGAGTIRIVHLGAELGGSDFAVWTPWLVLGPGQALQAQVTTAQHVGIVASGSIYTI